MKITGVRAAESSRRAKQAGMIKIIGKPKKVQKTAEKIGADYSISSMGGIVMNMDNDENRRLVEHCYRTTMTMINPILDWTDDDVWEFLNHYGCQANPLYQCGKKRIGCIGCPMQSATRRIADFERYPKYKNLYIKAFDRMLAAHPEKEYRWKNGVDVFDWWTGFDSNQLMFDL